MRSRVVSLGHYTLAVKAASTAIILVEATPDVLEERLEEAETGIDKAVARPMIVLSEMICAQRQSRTTTVEDLESCIEGVEGVVDGYVEGGSVDDDVFDFEAYALVVEGLGEAVKARREDPSRRHCTYVLKSAQTTSQRYYGKSSGRTSESCEDIVDRRYIRHIWAKRIGFTTPPPEEDMLSDGIQGYIDITGREQQLVDKHVYDRVPLPWAQGRLADDVRNRRRPVGKRNPLGCVYWLASNAKFGNIRSVYRQSVIISSGLHGGSLVSVVKSSKKSRHSQHA